MGRRDAARRDEGSAVVEFALVVIPLLLLFAAVVQVAVYLHVHSVVVASAAEGARYGANADRAAAEGGPYAEELIGRGLSAATGIRCVGGEVVGAGGAVLVEVRCRGVVSSIVPGTGRFLRLDVVAHALAER